MMVGGFVTLGAAYLSTTAFMSLTGEDRLRVAIPVVGPLLVLDAYDSYGSAALVASSVVQTGGLLLGTLGAMRYTRHERARPLHRNRGRGVLALGASVFASSYIPTAALGAVAISGGETRSGLLMVPIAGPLAVAADGEWGSLGDGMVAISLVQAAGVAMAIVGATRLARSRRALQRGYANLNVNVGPTPALDGGLVQLTYRW